MNNIDDHTSTHCRCYMNELSMLLLPDKSRKSICTLKKPLSSSHGVQIAKDWEVGMVKDE